MTDTPTPDEPRAPTRARRPTLPVLLAFALLAAVVAWGWSTGWSAPAFATLLGTRGDATPSDDWCAEHGVPESVCIACDPTRTGRDPSDWCREHGVPESRCTLCRPSLLVTGVPGDWCEAHGLPESGCTICHPELARLARDDEGVDPDAWVRDGDHDHESPEDHPPGADAAAALGLRDSRTCQKHALRVQFASPASLEKCGVAFGRVVTRPMAESLVVNAELRYDGTRHARLAARASGSVACVVRAPGDTVRAGDVLLVVDLPEAARAKAGFLAARAALDAAARDATRVVQAADQGLRTEAERLAALAARDAAEAGLLLASATLAGFGLPSPAPDADAAALAALGLPDAVRALLPSGAATLPLVPVLAPFDGTVVALPVVVGEPVDPSRTLVELADTRRMWVELDVPPAEAHRVARGDAVIFRPDDARDEVVTGTLDWLATAVDETTRTVGMRASVGNPDGALRAHAFGRAQVVVRSSPEAVAVPSSAVQWEGCCWIVFVRESDTVFQTRKVRLGARDAAYTEVLAGVLPGEVVATTGSHVLKSKILESLLGAGCVDD